MTESLLEICRSHFNEPMLAGNDELCRCIGYGEDERDCYIIVKRKDGTVFWQTCVGGYCWLDRLKGQCYVKSTEGEDWDDFVRLDKILD